MSELTASKPEPDPDETILLSFLEAIEGEPIQAEDVVRDYCARYPHLAGRFRTHAALGQALDAALGEEGGEAAGRPDRLGDFRIVRELGRGGMGAIFEAVQEPLGRRVAVKTIRGQRRQLSEPARSRFLREQQVLARLHHTHIVPIHAAGSDGDLQYFAMPYIEGASLSRVIQMAQRHGSSDAPRLETPSLAELADEARSDPSGRDAGQAGESGVPGDGVPGANVRPRRDRRLPAADRYFRSVARAMRDAAEAVQHAHDAGIVHRDLKPSNLMVDSQEHCWVLDFGLAGHRRDQAERTTGSAATSLDIGLDPITATGTVLGTYPYMAPEQFDGRSDARSDVWGLGVTLFELLTLRRAFGGTTLQEVREQVHLGVLPPLRGPIGPVPTDLARICLKATRVDPGLRYESARDFGADLDRWLRGEPTSARPAWPHRRAWLWSRRNPGWAAAMALAVASLVVLTAGAIVLADAARSVASAAQREAQSQRREAAIQQVQRIRLTAHDDGWRGRIETLIGEAAGPEEARASLQSQLAASLMGIDARPVKRFDEFGAYSLAFDREGRLLMGTLRSTPGPDEDVQPARRWGPDDLSPETLRAAAWGPVGLRPDGTPIQLAIREEDGSEELSIIDLESGEPLTRFEPPGRLSLRLLGEIGMAPDGSIAAAPVDLEDGSTVLAVWDGTSGALLRQFDGRPTRVAFPPDGSLVAAGSEDGRIRVWSVETGREVAALRSAETAISSLAFGNRRHQGPGADPESPGDWWLASGDSGGTVTIWDLGLEIPRAYATGSPYDVYSVAFSPDDTILASAGRTYAMLWDTTSGRSLLRITARADFMSGLAFSPDGRRLAISGFLPAGPGQLSVSVWELEDGRGIRAYRGLSERISKVIFSPDGGRLAAVTHGWKIGVWDRESGQLLHLFEGPRGLTADNAGLALSPDGLRLAASAGGEARLWDVETGRRLESWPLPEGKNDTLVFRGPDQLLSIREETESGELGPYSNAPAGEHPRVCRLRDLLGPDPTEPIRELTDFSWGVDMLQAAPDGSSFVIAGVGDPREEAYRVIAFEGPTGEPIDRLPCQRAWRPQSGCYLAYDPSGRSFFLTTTDDNGKPALFDVPSFDLVGTYDGLPDALGSGAELFVQAGGDSPELVLRQRGRDDPLLATTLDMAVSSTLQLDRDGRRVVLGTSEGTVLVGDLAEIQRRLSAIGLGW